MKIKKCFYIMKTQECSQTEELIYGIISKNSDATGKSRITREKLSKLSGISDLDAISDYTSKLQKKGLITKSAFYINGAKHITYFINKISEDFLWVANAVFDDGPELIGFLLKFAQLRYKNTNWIGLGNSKIIKEMHVGHSQFYTKIELLIKRGFVEKIDNGYILNEEYFPVTDNYVRPTAVEAILAMPDNATAKKIFLNYYNPDLGIFKNLKMSPSAFTDWCLSGCPGLKQKKTKEKIPEIDYKF